MTQKEIERAKANEAWFSAVTFEHRREIAGWHWDATGEDINGLNKRDYEFALKDLGGRVPVSSILKYKRESVSWGDVKSPYDCMLSGGPLEVKVLFCGVDFYDDPTRKDRQCTMLDKYKVDELSGYTGARVIYLYPDAETKTIGCRWIWVSDIVKNGEVRTKGGRKDSFGRVRTDKEVVYFPTRLTHRSVLKKGERWLRLDG